MLTGEHIHHTIAADASLHGNAPGMIGDDFANDGGVTFDGQKITDDKTRVTLKNGQILKTGKLVVVKLVVT